MAEEEDPWGFDDGDVQAEISAGDTGAPAIDTVGDGGVPAAGGDTGARGEEPPPPPVEDGQYRKPVQLYRHWVRPRFLQYKYMYNYRTNYYDDVIDYLDKRQIGIGRDVPRAQTWAERVLRTNASTKGRDDFSCQRKPDSHLVQTLAASIRTHNYHTKAYINQRYASVL